MTTFKKGDKVKVYNRTLGGVRFIEGIATIMRQSELGGNFYIVSFKDGYSCMRNLNDAELVKESQ